MSKEDLFLSEIAKFASFGIKTIKEDEFSKCFLPHKINPSQPFYYFYLTSIVNISFAFVKISLFCLIGILTLPLTIFMFISQNENFLNFYFVHLFKILVLLFSIRIKKINKKPRLSMPHIFTANHSCILDYLIISSDQFANACVAEKHGGLFSFIFNYFLSKNGSISFKRTEKSAREDLNRKLKLHLQNKKIPMLVFPEGTCVNNKYTVLFQKGVFELNVPICPVSIKYKIDDHFDPYWNRREQSFIAVIISYLFRGRIDVTIHYHDPVSIMEGESVTEFTNRVKNMISDSAQLVSTQWNGYMKNHISQKENRLLDKCSKYIANNYQLSKLTYTDFARKLSDTYLKMKKRRKN